MTLYEILKFKVEIDIIKNTVIITYTLKTQNRSCDLMLHYYLYLVLPESKENL